MLYRLEDPTRSDIVAGVVVGSPRPPVASSWRVWALMLTVRIAPFAAFSLIASSPSKPASKPLDRLFRWRRASVVLQGMALVALGLRRRQRTLVC